MSSPRAGHFPATRLRAPTGRVPRLGRALALCWLALSCSQGTVTSELGGRWVTGDVFILGGITQAVVGGQIQNEGQFRTDVLAEHPEGEWNQLRIRVDGDKSATYELNGLELNTLASFKKQEGDTYVTLDRGKVALQAEYAELWYRSIRIQELAP